MSGPTQEEDRFQIGVSRPSLPRADLPSPEEVFQVKKTRLKEILRLVLGPSMIALGVSIGSGEWLLGPMAVGKHGFIGLGWVILVSAILQVFYNIEVARFTVATGEVPVVAFGRTPPGIKLWLPLTLFLIYLSWIWGGWASAAGQSLFTLFAGRLHRPEELELVRGIGIGLLSLSFVLFLFGRKISQTMEAFNKIMVYFILAFLIILTIAIVPAGYWGGAFASLLKFSRPPAGMDVSLLGAVAGYTAFASGMNFMLINYYRDKGYGMGYRVGYIAGLIGGKRQAVLPSGIIFRASQENARLWRRWFRFLMLDQWAVFFTGAIIGMMVPSILVGYLSSLPGAGIPDQANMPIYAATELRRLYGPILFFGALFIGAVTLFKTQATILEMLVRNTTDAAYGMSERFRKYLKGDSRRFYYPFALFLIILIGAIIHLAIPTRLLVISANMANLAAVIYPFVLMYLNSRLPRPAKITWRGYVFLLLNVVFFGFFFANFMAVQVTGTPLVKF